MDCKMESIVVYKDMKNNCWWEYHENGFKCSPFGHYVFTVINTCSALLQDREKFIELEYFYQSHIKNMAYSSALSWLDESGILSKEKMGKYYDDVISCDSKLEAYKPEYLLLLEYIKSLDGFRNGENSTSSLLGIYNNFKYFATSITSDIHPYISDTKKRNDFFDDIYDELITYKGPGFLESVSEKEKLTPIEEYRFTEMFNIFILDFWEFLFNPVYQKTKILVCPNCKSIFASSNNKAKYCEVCKQPEIMGKIRYANRKANKARKLHHDIATLSYSLNTKENDVSNSFLNESNYYWDIVQGKNPEKIKEYSAKIKTEADYMKWLEKKYEEIKAQK